MKEGRAERLGEYIAREIIQISRFLEDPTYTERVKQVLSTYEFKTRKKGDPPIGNESLLEGVFLEAFNIANPEHFAALLLERGHLNYNAHTANRVRASIIANLSLLEKI
jgi:hypothetical protein